LAILTPDGVVFTQQYIAVVAGSKTRRPVAFEVRIVAGEKQAFQCSGLGQYFSRPSLSFHLEIFNEPTKSPGNVPVDHLVPGESPGCSAGQRRGKAETHGSDTSVDCRRAPVELESPLGHGCCQPVFSATCVWANGEVSIMGRKVLGFR
jgi:hypothetical protein